MLDNPNIARVNLKNVFIRMWQELKHFYWISQKLCFDYVNWNLKKNLRLQIWIFFKGDVPTQSQNDLNLKYIANYKKKLGQLLHNCTPTPAPEKVAHGLKKKKTVGERKTRKICQRAREAQCTEKGYVLVSPDEILIIKITIFSDYLNINQILMYKINWSSLQETYL